MGLCREGLAGYYALCAVPLLTTPVAAGCDEKWTKRLSRHGSAPSAKGACVERHCVSCRGRDGPATFASRLDEADSEAGGRR